MDDLTHATRHPKPKLAMRIRFTSVKKVELPLALVWDVSLEYNPFIFFGQTTPQATLCLHQSGYWW